MFGLDEGFWATSRRVVPQNQHRGYTAANPDFAQVKTDRVRRLFAVELSFKDRAGSLPRLTKSEAVGLPSQPPGFAGPATD